MSMRIQVDQARCHGHQMCAIAAPKLFGSDEIGNAAVLIAGDVPRALSLFEEAVDTSFYPHQFFAVYCPFLGPLRGTPEFERILAKAERRVREFSA